MSQNNTQTPTVSHADQMAIDALFKRIAERGRKIRAQAQPQVVEEKNKVLNPKQAGRVHDNHK